MKHFVILFILCLSANVAYSQDTLRILPDTLLQRIELDTTEEIELATNISEPVLTEMEIKGKVYSAMVTEEGDTIIINEDVLF